MIFYKLESGWIFGDSQGSGATGIEIPLGQMSDESLSVQYGIPSSVLKAARKADAEQQIVAVDEAEAAEAVAEVAEEAPADEKPKKAKKGKK